MGPMIFLLGALVLTVVAGVVYLFQHPETLGFLQNRITAVKKDSQTDGPRQRIGYRAGPLSFTEQMTSLEPDALLTVRDPKTGRDAKLQVVTTETLHGCRQYRGSSEWKRSGDDWTAVLCVADPSFSKTEVLIIQTDTMGFVFRKRVRMGPEGAALFGAKGQEFSKQGQKSGSVSMKYDGKTYAIQDIGVWDIEGTNDESHVSSGVLVRWIIAMAADESAILVEDAKGNADSVWLGDKVDLDRVITDVLTKEG